MSYLDTLRRIPNDIFLDIFARDFDEQRGQTCICGWALRDRLSELSGASPDEIDAYTAGATWAPVYERCMNLFGGTRDEWSSLYWDASSRFGGPRVEEAVVDRLNEIVP